MLHLLIIYIYFCFNKGEKQERVIRYKLTSSAKTQLYIDRLIHGRVNYFHVSIVRDMLKINQRYIYKIIYINIICMYIENNDNNI